MELTQTELTQVKIAQTRTQPNSPRFFTIAAADRLKVFWRSVVCRAGSKRKTLAVRETAALGDRRFVSVIQFERQRFLIGSSPSSVTLLSQLPDESSSGEESRKESGEKN
jgi:flagellar biogenesis protein FliO